MTEYMDLFIHPLSLEFDNLRKIVNKIRSSTKYKKWRKAVVRRDNYICQKCGKQEFLYLHAHHKKSIFGILLDNKIKTFEEALNNRELWDLNNGISLCAKCHKKGMSKSESPKGSLIPVKEKRERESH